MYHLCDVSPDVSPLRCVALGGRLHRKAPGACACRPLLTPASSPGVARADAWARRQDAEVLLWAVGGTRSRLAGARPSPCRPRAAGRPLASMRDLASCGNAVLFASRALHLVASRDGAAPAGPDDLMLCALAGGLTDDRTLGRSEKLLVGSVAAGRPLALERDVFTGSRHVPPAARPAPPAPCMLCRVGGGRAQQRRQPTRGASPLACIHAGLGRHGGRAPD